MAKNESYGVTAEAVLMYAHMLGMLATMRGEEAKRAVAADIQAHTQHFIDELKPNLQQTVAWADLIKWLKGE